MQYTQAHIISFIFQVTPVSYLIQNFTVEAKCLGPENMKKENALSTSKFLLLSIIPIKRNKL